ncbi:MAG: uracil-DNA glycosylase family protein [Rikenellaceae bacterium]|nr:uracil-DNA glycosylase family protein [Rikenellaceae bacterium]
MPTERHTLEPFLPEGTNILMLGSFPPERKRWSMEFFYPNWGNDMWRIWGLIFFGDKQHFEITTEKRFDGERIATFCAERGVALYDTACEVRRLAGNASDKFLEVVTPTDLRSLLRRLPHCRAIVTTGEKATDTLIEQFGCAKPRVGEYTGIEFEGRTLRLYRMPSSSRAYPLKLERKAEAYERMLREIGML